jgi:hypothetical protein
MPNYICFHGDYSFVPQRRFVFVDFRAWVVLPEMAKFVVRPQSDMLSVFAAPLKLLLTPLPPRAQRTSTMLKTPCESVNRRIIPTQSGARNLALETPM